ncbi:MAG: hypothetical protein QME27_05625 [Syntrophaceae bacterium]|nr:hypothetical protein [Syntrophaceae bacterium]
MPSVTISVSGAIIALLVEDARNHTILDRNGSPSPGQMASRILQEHYKSRLNNNGNKP